MLRRSSIFLFFLSVMCALGALSERAYSGLVMQQVVYEEGSPSKQQVTLYIQDNKLKQVENAGQFSPAVIFDLNSGNIIFVNDEKKLYITLNRDEYLKYIESFMSENKNAPQEKRDVKLKKTGETGNFAGYASKKLEIYDNGKLQTEYWVSKEPGFSEEIDLDKMSKLMNEVKKISQNIGGSASISDNEYKVIQEIYEEGYPMKTVYYAPEGGGSVVEEIISVKKEDIPAAEFLPPAGYEKITYQDILNQQ
ncbi:MAG: DUF4412 domain-containing protein [Candidatus Dadabacteria bacterium]|nr:DUF4412 domain-containing protein [Candidatus Dadabacteria bacterium]